MHIKGHEILSQKLLCAIGIQILHLESGSIYGCIHALVSWVTYIRGENIVYCHGQCISQERILLWLLGHQRGLLC